MNKTGVSGPFRDMNLSALKDANVIPMPLTILFVPITKYKSEAFKIISINAVI